MKRAWVALLLIVLSACAGGRGALGEGRLAARASPSAVIAAELAFARAAREEGTWTAFRAFATKDAQWPTPRWVNVHASLKNAPDPAQAIVWQPDLVWASCDGSFALSTGPATDANGRRSRYATVWQRQNNGGYRWVLDQGFDLEGGYAEPEMIAGRVADCPSSANFRTGRAASARRSASWTAGRSDDGTLAWDTTLGADCSRTLVVRAMKDGAMSEVFHRVSPVPPVAPGEAAARC